MIYRTRLPYDWNPAFRNTLAYKAEELIVYQQVLKSEPVTASERKLLLALSDIVKAEFKALSKIGLTLGS